MQTVQPAALPMRLLFVGPHAGRQRCDLRIRLVIPGGLGQQYVFTDSSQGCMQ